MSEGAEYILSIDQGTTGSRAFVFDKAGRIVSSSYREFRQIYPGLGWVEHDPAEIIKSVDFVSRQALQKANIRPAQIAAIGITNQRETTVLWERKTGKPVYNAIVWQCRRTSGMCEKLKSAGYAGLFQEKTGLVIDAYFSGTKIKWLLDNVKGLRRRAQKGDICFGTIDSWLIWNLTGGKTHATDYTNASRTMIFNIRDKEWDSDLLKILNIPHAILAQVKPSSSLLGSTARNVCGFVPGTPIAGDAGDQQAALFGQGCFEAGSMKNTYGTGCFLLMNTGKKAVFSKSGLLATLACDRQGRPCFALEGSVFIAGAAVQWLRDGLKVIRSAAETQEWAKSVRGTGGVYFVPAFVGLGAPYWDSAARGTITGLTRATSKAQVIRATLEAIAYQVKDAVELMQQETGRRLNYLKVDGGACRNDFLMQFQADILNTAILRPRITETTAGGAAMLAGLAVGFYKDTLQFKKALTIDRKFLPQMQHKTRRELYDGWKNAINKARSA